MFLCETQDWTSASHTYLTDFFNLRSWKLFWKLRFEAMEHIQRNTRVASYRKKRERGVLRSVVVNEPDCDIKLLRSLSN